jgi:hypothetical protein
MVDGLKTAPLVGRPRRVIGLFLLALGCIITARDLWLGLFYWSGFSAESRIRFVFLLWAGMVLTLAGCWLAFKLRFAGWALIVVIASLAILVYSYGRWWS